MKEYTVKDLTSIMQLLEGVYAPHQHKKLKDILFLVIGILLFSVYAGLLVPYNGIGASGTIGIGLIMQKYFGIPIGTTQLALNVPLFYIAYKYIGKQFLLLTGATIFASSFLINNLPNIVAPVELHDSLVAAIFCGIISGIAMSVLLIAGASTGGTDITGKFLAKRFKWSIPTVFLMQDILVYSLIWLTFDIQHVMYALIMSFVRNQTMKNIQRFFSAYIQCSIICLNPQEVVSAINSRLGRGSTIIEVEGGYSHQKQYMIILIIQQNELHTLKKIIAQTSPKSFITITNISNILGNFKEHSYEL